MGAHGNDRNDAGRGRRRRKRLLALALSLVLTVLAAEALVRTWFGVPLSERLPLMVVRANPYRGWEMVPGQTHYTYQQRVEVNALGLRGPALASKQPGEERLLFLGDSLTYGQGMAEDATVPAVLERALMARAPDRSWRVVNAGNRAYGTSQELGLLEELGPRIQPDVVLLGWYWNDVSERPIQATCAEFQGRGEFVFDTENRLEGLERGLWHAQELARRSALVMLTHDLLWETDGLFAPAVHEQGMQLLERLFQRFKEQCARLGATPAVVIFPDSHRLTGGEDTRPFEELAATLARAHELPVIELLPALVSLYAATKKVPILPFDGHYDVTANAAMGAYLAEHLLASGVPKRAE